MYKYLLDLDGVEHTMEIAYENDFLVISLHDKDYELKANVWGNQPKLPKGKKVSLSYRRLQFDHKDMIFSLPFHENSFDLIIVRGILERVSNQCKLASERSQIEFLLELNRLLSADGQLLIGMENRYSYNSIIGRPDSITGLRFVSIMPRIIGNYYSLILSCHPYRIYLHSFGGFKRLLKKAEFSKYKICGVHPSYHKPMVICQINNPEGMYRLICSISKLKMMPYALVKRFSKSLFAKTITPSYVAIARKNKYPVSSLERFIKDEFGNRAIISWLSYSHPGVVMGSFKNLDIRYIFRIAIDEFGRTRITQNWKTIRDLNSNYSRVIKNIIPKPIKLVKFKGRLMTIETMLTGETLTRVNYLFFGKNYTKKAKSWISKLHRNCRLEMSTDVWIRKWIGELKKTLTPDSEVLFKMIFCYLSTHCDLNRSVVTRVHGDFSPKNVLIDRKRKILSGIVDWDTSQNAAPDFVDYLHWDIRGKAKDPINAHKMLKTKLKFLSVNNEVESDNNWWETSLWAHIIYGLWYNHNLSKWNPLKRNEMMIDLLDFVHQIISYKTER